MWRQIKKKCVEQNQEGKKYHISLIFLDSIEFVCTVERDKWGGDQLICLETSLASSLQGASELQGMELRKTKPVKLKTNCKLFY